MSSYDPKQASDQFVYRRFADGAVVFDRATWQTHVLSPAAAIVFEALAEVNDGRPVSETRAFEVLRDELELDTDTPPIQHMLHSLREMGMLGG